MEQQKRAQQITSLAAKLSWEVRELSLGTSGEIERIHGAPSPLRFLRDFVLPNKPCIITHAIDHWPALSAWSNAYLRAALTNQQVSVHFTPNGFADALVDVNRISSDFGCIIEPPLPPCNLVGAECHPHSAQSHHCVGAFADAPAGCRDNVPLDLGEHSVVELPTSSPQLNSNQSARADDAHMANGHVDAFANEAACIDDGGDANGVRSGADSCAKSNSAMRISCNLQGKEHLSSYDTCTYAGQSSSTSREEKLQQTWFVTAHVECMPFSTALDLILHSEIGNGVAYAQEQNGCFLSEYSALAADAETHLPWATEAFGCLPEAVNLWIGNEKAVTSFHKDHYENLYAVIAGEKHFTLLPPTDVHRLCIRRYPSARYVKHKGKFIVEQVRPSEVVPWVSVDPYPPAKLASEAKSQFPEYFNGPSPFTCTLQAGEILYLPSMWFHHVRQSPDREGRTIALNFWYDMQFDVKYAYFNFLESLMHNS